MLTRCTAILLTGLALLNSPALVHTASANDKKAPQTKKKDKFPALALETTTIVGTRTERVLSEVATTISVKTANDLEAELTRNIADLVRFEPGVAVAGTGSRFGLGGFTIRGIGGNRVVTLVDGIRVADEFSFGPFLSARRDFVEMDSLQRVEIARGPISSLYGSDALGGVVAFTTKGPRDYLTDSKRWYTKLKTGYSGVDESIVGSVTAAAGNDWVSAMGLYTRRDSSETKNSGSLGGIGSTREQPDPQDIETDNVIAKLTLHPGDAHEVTLGFDRFANKSETQVLSDYGSETFGTTIDQRDADDQRTRTRWSLAYRYHGDTWLADNAQATLYQQQSETEQVTSEQRTSPARARESRQRASFFDQDIVGAFVQLGKPFKLAGTSHYLSYGLDYYQTENAGLRDGATFDAAGAPLAERSVFPTRDFPGTDVEQFAVFLQDEIALFNGRLLLSPSARYDRFDADATADTFYLTGNPGSPLPEDYDDAEVTAKLGAVYNFTDNVSAYARFAEGFRAPPYNDVNVGFSNFAAGYKTISNPDLESERSDSVELGLRVQGDFGNVTVAAFQNDYENFIESSAIAPQFLDTGGIDPADGLQTFQSVNRNEVDISGAELSGTFEFSAVNAALSGLALRAAIAYAEGEDKDSGEPINSIEPLTGVLGLGFATVDDRWGAELILTAVDNKDADDIDASMPRLPTSGYGIIDLLAHVNVSKRIRINVGLFNLGDKSYIRWADTASIGDDAAARFTQPGFNAGVNLRIEL